VLADLVLGALGELLDREVGGGHGDGSWGSASRSTC